MTSAGKHVTEQKRHWLLAPRSEAYLQPPGDPAAPPAGVYPRETEACALTKIQSDVHTRTADHQMSTMWSLHTPEHRSATTWEVGLAQTATGWPSETS